MRIISLRKEYLSLLPSMIASLFSANGAAAVIDSCQGYDIKANCQASRQSLSGNMQDWSIADGQWLIFSGMANNASGGAVFLQHSAEFTISPQNETGMTLFADNSVSGEYNNGGAIFAKENSTINLANVIFDSNVAGGYGGAIYSACVPMIPVPPIYVSLTPYFTITSLMTAKAVQFIPSIITSI